MIIVVNSRLSYYSYCYNYLLFLLQETMQTKDACMDGAMYTRNKTKDAWMGYWDTY